MTSVHPQVVETMRAARQRDLGHGYCTFSFFEQ